MTPVARIKRAIRRIERDGICRGIYHHKDGRWCIAGAMGVTYSASLEACNCVTRLLGFETLGDVTAWHDHFGRTKAQVLARLRAALRRERKKEGR